MPELGAMDMGFMDLEDTDRRVSLGIGAVAIIDGRPPARGEIRAGLLRGVQRNARLRQRVRRAPLDLTAPVWEDDSAFDVAHHIRWTGLPDPCDEAVLRELVAAELSERLDRDHPLWQVVVVEHLAGERWAMIIKAHHSMVDGISGVTLVEDFCDTGDEPAPASSPRHQDSSSHQPGRIRQVAELPLAIPRYAIGMAAALVPVVFDAIAPAGGSSLNGPLGRQRRYALARTTLPQVRAIGAALGVTVNDVAVAAIAGAYRRLLLGRGEQPRPDTLRIVVPVSTRAADAKYAMGNRVSAMIPYLPVDLDDPVERLHAVHERIAEHRSRGEAEAETSLLSLAARLPSGFVSWAFRMAERYPQRSVGALATNVPGPRRRLTVDGHEVLEIWPCIPIAMRLRTTIAILSYADQLVFGITGDYDSTPDIDVIASSIEDEIAELSSYASEHKAPVRPGPS